MWIRLKQKRQLIIHFLQEEVMVELELQFSSSHLGCKTLCCHILSTGEKVQNVQGQSFLGFDEAFS
jgi:hypothetical protein